MSPIILKGIGIVVAAIGGYIVENADKILKPKKGGVKK